MLVAIHQPNFFPWLGYFDKIIRSDVFVFLDNVQFPKKGGTWLNRVQIGQQGKSQWFTAPIDRAYSGFRSISEMVFKDHDWKPKFLTTLRVEYGRTAFFREIFPLLERWVLTEELRLAEFNRTSILGMLDYLKLPVPRFELASELGCNGNATDLLIEIVEAVKGDTYLCGGGAGGYQEDGKFAERNLKLEYQAFEHPIYPQCNDKPFVPGLSILDSMFRLGPALTRQLLVQKSHETLTPAA